MAIPAIFADFLLSEEGAYINTPTKIKEAVSYRSSFLRRMLASKSADDILAGGDSIRSFIQLDDAGTAHMYGIGKEESPTQPQTVSELRAAYRYLRGDMTWDDNTLLLNTAGKAPSHRYRWLFDFKKQIQQACWIDKIKLVERNLWASPDGSEMESLTAGEQPYSLTCFNHEENSGGIPGGFTADSVTTLEGIAPATKTAWANQALGYDDSAATMTGANPMLKAMSKMARLCHYDGLPVKPQYGDSALSPTIVITSLEGINYLETVFRSSQDLFAYVGRQDPTSPKPTIWGVPVDWADWLTSAATYPAGSNTYATQSAATYAGARFHFFQLEDISLKFHSERYFEPLPMQTPYRQPSRHTVYVDTYYNLVCTNRRTQGTVYPTASVGSWSTY